MSCKGLCIGAFHGLRQELCCTAGFIGTYVFIIDKVSSSGYIDHCCVCSFHFDTVVGDVDFAFLGLYLRTGFKADGTRNAFVCRAMSGQQQAFTVLFYFVFFVRSAISSDKIDCSRFVGFDTHNQSIICQGCKHGTSIVYFTYFITYRGYRFLQIQFPAIIGIVSMSFKFQH